MRILALAAAASMSLVPTLSMAQTGCPANAILRDSACVCADGYSLAADGACVSNVSAEGGETIGATETTVAVESGGTAGLPVLGSVPPGAAVVGGLVVLAGVAIGIAAASSDSTSDVTTTTTTTTTE